MDQATAPRAILRYKRRAKTCAASGKFGHKTKRKARIFAERGRAVTGLHLYVYQCHSCGLWHLSKQAPRAEA